MKNKILPRSLKYSIAVIICLTIFVFSFLGISIHNMSENTIEAIGTAYMAGMNEQVSLHFETIIELRLTMAESIVPHPVTERGRRSNTARRRGIFCAPLCIRPTAGSR